MLWANSFKERTARRLGKNRFNHMWGLWGGQYGVATKSKDPVHYYSASIGPLETTDLMADRGMLPKYLGLANDKRLASSACVCGKMRTRYEPSSLEPTITPSQMRSDDGFTTLTIDCGGSVVPWDAGPSLVALKLVVTGARLRE